MYNFLSDPHPRPKRVTWGGSTYSAFESTDGDESTGTLADEGPSTQEPRDRAAKGRVHENFFSGAPTQVREAENIVVNLSSKQFSRETIDTLNLGLSFVPTPSSFSHTDLFI